MSFVLFPQENRCVSADCNAWSVLASERLWKRIMWLQTQLKSTAAADFDKICKKTLFELLSGIRHWLLRWEKSEVSLCAAGFPWSPPAHAIQQLQSKVKLIPFKLRKSSWVHLGNRDLWAGKPDNSCRLLPKLLRFNDRTKIISVLVWKLSFVLTFSSFLGLCACLLLSKQNFNFSRHDSADFCARRQLSGPCAKQVFWLFLLVANKRVHTFPWDLLEVPGHSKLSQNENGQATGQTSSPRWLWRFWNPKRSKSCAGTKTSTGDTAQRVDD